MLINDPLKDNKIGVQGGYLSSEKEKIRIRSLFRLFVPNFSCLVQFRINKN